MSLVALIKGTGESGFGYSSTAEEITEGLDLSSKTYLVTGSNSGLGAETCRVLSMRGATIVGAARTHEKAAAAVADLPGEGIPLACELSEPDSVRDAVATVVEKGIILDAIIANAGIMALPELTQQYGYEMQFFTNHVGHFMLVTGLLENLADDGRVVLVSSSAHQMAPGEGIQFDNLSGEDGYQPWTAYGQSKLANVLMARELARQFEGTNKTANALHPGVIKTNLGRHMNPIINAAFSVFSPLAFKTIPQGAATQTYVATHPSLIGVSGEYFQDCNLEKTTRHGQDMRLAKRLWEETERIVESL